jgi:Cleft lip and palate transmembrane protein 1 (CLPTM1)
MVKYAPPTHISKPRRILLHDISFVIKQFFLGSKESPPWEMEHSKPKEHRMYQKSLEMKRDGVGYPYWKPEVAVKYVNDEQAYPGELVTLSGMPLVQVPRSKMHPTGAAFIPALHVDEIGLTSEKYMPLRISYDRNDMEHEQSGTTANSGGISPARWRLLNHFSQAIEQQSQLGFEQSDIDDLRRLVADTNVTLLAITMLASALHLLFEFLTFKSEVSFWSKNTDLTGLSVRSLFLDMFGQFVILLFLIEKDSSLLMTIPSAVGVLIALWKCQRAAGLRFVKVQSGEARSTSWWNVVPQLIGYELRATRLEQRAAKREEKNKSDAKSTGQSPSSSPSSPSQTDLTALTMESDRIATRTLGVLVLPLVVGYTLYSLAYEEHAGWYSWLISSASSAVYALGFVLMTPQLFLNWKLKSVAHLPWRVLVYKSLNTFIDDLFSFIIRMPTMARISCFRDDVVFFIYLYQRWLYPVDKSRPVEGGGDGASDSAEVTKEKKTQ